MRCRTIAEIEFAPRDLHDKIVIIEMFVQPRLRAPVRRRLRAGRRWQIPAEGLEHLPDKSFRRPVGQTDPPTTPADPRQFGSGLVLIGGKHHPERRQHRGKTAIGERQGFRVGDLKSHFQMFGAGAILAALQQHRNVIGRGHQTTAPRRCQGRIAVAGSHIKHLFIAAQIAGFGEVFADNLQCGADHGVVATGPGDFLAFLQGSEINRGTHEFELRLLLGGLSTIAPSLFGVSADRPAAP